jgi:hypothetical protein
MTGKFDRSTLLHKDTRRGIFLDRYYELLNRHPPFHEALASLAQQYWAIQAVGEHRRQWDLGDEREAHGKQYELLAAFVVEWRLPRDLGLRHLRHSVELADGELPVRLTSDGSLYSGRSLGILITPPQPEPFHYDPVWETPHAARARARTIAKAVQTNIIEQLKAVEDQFRAEGWDNLPKPGEWPRVASRVFRRAVLRQAWEAIAAEDQVAVETVRETVERRAAEFEIPLPDIPPGRPPKNPEVSA